MIRFFFYLSVAATALLYSCDKKDLPDAPDEQPDVEAPTQAIGEDFTSRFPGVTQVAWIQKNGYEIASFNTAYTRSAATDPREVEAWYLSAGSCEMITADFSEGLPSTIENAWKASEFYEMGSSILVDAELITRDNKTHLYKLEVADAEFPDEEGYDLFYSTDARLLSYLPDTNTPQSTKNNNLPTPVEYKKYIIDNYAENCVLTVYFDEDSSLGKVCDIDVFSQNKAYYITFNDQTKTFHREHSFWTLDEVPAVIKNGVLDVESGADDENTEIERVKDTKGISYMVQVDTRFFELDEDGLLIE